MKFPTHCKRCGADLSRTASSMSYMNDDTCCMPCLEDEKGAPGYAAARAAENAAVVQRTKLLDSNAYKPFYNYSHGLTAEDRAYLASRRAERERGTQ